MLSEFITANRDELIARARAKVAKRLAPRPTERELTSGVPVFLDQLAGTLQRPPTIPPAAMERSAAVHGAALLDRGYSVAQVVHDYGDIYEAVTELAHETAAAITSEELHTLSRCLDNAIAESVTEFSRLRDQWVTEGQTERLGILAHELRNQVTAAQLAFNVIKTGRAPVGGSVAYVVARSLDSITAVINRALVEVRLNSGHMQRQRVRLQHILECAEVEGTLEAETYGVSLSVESIDRVVDLEADPQILAGVLANLLQNAFKFTRSGGHVTLRSSVVGDHVHIEVEDECGGLPPGKVDELFGAFQQRGTNRSGLGLGLFISRRSVESTGGELRVRDVPGTGCVFTVDLPLMPAAS